MSALQPSFVTTWLKVGNYLVSVRAMSLWHGLRQTLLAQPPPVHRTMVVTMLRPDVLY